MIRLHLTQGDGIGWAIDEDARLMREALSGQVEFTSLAEADIVLATWFIRLVGGPGQKPIPPASLDGKRILCWSPNRPYHDVTISEFGKAVGMVGRWIAGSSQARQELSALGLAASEIPYLVDTATFQELPKDDPSLAVWRERLGIPPECYVIGNFFRDTIGEPKGQPKLQKGPDVFLEIVRLLARRSLPIHVLLAGPRRSWLDEALARHGVPFSFAGERGLSDQDDLARNTLSRARLNQLYNLLDLYVVPSRWEGGPHAILEAVAAGCPVLSRPVGIARDVLDQSALFDHPFEAAAHIERDIADRALKARSSGAARRLAECHTPQAAVPLWRNLLEEAQRLDPFKGPAQPARRAGPGQKIRRILGRLRKPGPPSISLWNEFMKPPYGGGNQFMLALAKELSGRGVKVLRNAPRADVHIVNSVQFDVNAFRKRFGRRAKPRVIQRIDGPIHLYRGTNRELDELCFELNKEFAAATVIQSCWTFERLVEMGFEPVRPIVIRNAADPDIFHRKGRARLEPGRKVRLISTSWSSNARKGGMVYKWLDENLDWSRFEYTFLGNLSEELHNINRLAPRPSEDVAKALRAHDIYITASLNDPCSNALIEALSCGLPALYLDSGGHPELVGLGGMGFETAEEIPALLDLMVRHHGAFSSLIQAPGIRDIASAYLDLAREVAGG